MSGARRWVTGVSGGAVGLALVVGLTIRERRTVDPAAAPPSGASARPVTRPASRPLAPRPARSLAGAAEREERLLALVEGRIALDTLPETAIDQNDAWDPTRRETIGGAPPVARIAKALVTEGPVSIEGPLPVADARRVLGTALDRIRRCHQSVLDSDSSARGVVRVALAISSGGHVASVRDEETRFPEAGDPTGVRCMVSAWRSLVFAQAAAGSVIHTSVSLRGE